MGVKEAIYACCPQHYKFAVLIYFPKHTFLPFFLSSFLKEVLRPAPRILVMEHVCVHVYVEVEQRKHTPALACRKLLWWFVLVPKLQFLICKMGLASGKGESMGMSLEYQRTHISADTLMSFSAKMSGTCVDAGTVMMNQTEGCRNDDSVHSQLYAYTVYPLLIQRALLLWLVVLVAQLLQYRAGSFLAH